ncbi:MAG: hypothetical protein RML34_10445 [Leptospiraceae bacterium]|nr:hypothetical protein [Leptospiraceae bacterium]
MSKRLWKRLKRVFSTSFPFVISLSCANNIPFLEERILKRPVGISITANQGLTFTLRYYVQNQEPTFDGYDLFIKREPIGDGEVFGALGPANLYGNLPTFLHGPEEFDPNRPIERLISTIDGARLFEAGVRYYFRICAHSRRGFRSDPSEEVSSIALP